MNFTRIVCYLILASVSLSGCTLPLQEDLGAGPTHEIRQEQPAITQKLPKPQTLSIAAVGDIMLGTDYPSDRLPPADGKGLLQHAAPVLSQADITFGNYEGTFLQEGEPAKQCRNPARCYVFRTPPRFVQQLSASGFDVMSLANNHARDFGDEGRMTTMKVLAEAGIHHSGLEGDIASWEVKGLKVAMIAYAPFRGAHNPLLLEQVKLSVQELAAAHDVLLVSMHMGAEGEEATRLPFTEEYFHGENRGDMVKFAHTAVDAGADLVIGHGPHVPRALELYKDRLVAYSLGNFCTYYGINVRGLNGLAPVLKARLTADGRFLDGEIISMRQYRPNGPMPDSSHQAARLIAELTRLDFPATPLEISPEGQIRIKSAP